MHDFIIAVILGIVEGLTEFLPVSSTGHMVLVGDMMHFTGNTASAFEVVIQLGAILAVFFAYKSTFLTMLKRENWFRKDGLSLVHIALGMIPACALAFLFRKFIKAYLFSTETVLFGLVVGGIFMIFAEKMRPVEKAHTVNDITYKQAFQIGCFQILSLWPGFSRSGSTMAGALLVGVNRKAGADFTFIMALPIMVLASGYEFLKVYKDLSANDLITFAIGFAVAFVVAYISILWFLKFLKRFTLIPFAIYRFGFAAIAAIYFFAIR